ncbi:MAG TPA: hypothetical protein VMU00_09725 [Steroidobacteraceae bacterium]|nr:hypothetical protein [Steroidobacteraceae bacterium]
MASTKPESCDTCHPSVGSQNHQAIYNQYVDPSALVMKFVSVVSTPVAGPPATYTVALTFTITNNGLPYVDANGLPSLLQKTFYAVQYNSSTRQFLNSVSMAASKVVATATPGTYVLTVTGFAYDPTAAVAPFDGAEVYGYIAKDLLNVESYTPATHYQLYANMSSAALAFGTAQATNASTYVSNADVAACQACHGTPYRKHGYREAIVGNGVAVPSVANATVPTFAPCKACHYDNRAGSDKGWQQEVNDPLGWATGKPIAATDYVYTANVMNDVHMSHAMEFQFPQSMANCSTCHTGPDVPGSKLANVRADSFFQAATCTSCHPVTDNSPTYPTEAGRAPALQALWTASNTTFHNTFAAGLATDCTTCHSTAAAVAPTFAQIHSGYDAAIYDGTGTRYSAQYGARIDSATLTGTCTAASTSGCLLDVVFEPTFTAPGTATIAATIVPTLAVSFYGYDTKDFLISRHTADGRTPTAACPGRGGGPSGCTMEWTVGSTNPLFTQVTRTDGKWEVQLDVAAWIPPAHTTGTIPAEIAAGRLKKAEISVQPALTVGGTVVALNVPSQTVDLTAPATTTGALTFVSNYFQGTNAIVDIAKCNKCHDALGPTFHGGQYAGNIVLCRSCHVPTSGAVTLEMQSRSIDSYVHGIHSFQGFGANSVGSVNFTDPVAAKHYATYIESTFPNFTVKNCEACHVTSNFSNKASTFPVTYEVPDQSMTIPGLLSGSNSLSHGWFSLDASGNPVYPAPADRNIGTVPPYATGPASRACGGCHRARLINDDDVGGLVSFNQHVNMGGYVIDTTQPSTTYPSASAYLYGVIDNIMSFFK